ncbi:MAG: signal peptidase II [Chloroflexi bacterium]|nr:signal peptidase II [Chloroflexota bacterium]
MTRRRNYRQILLAAFLATLAADVFSKAVVAHFLGNSVVELFGDVKLRILYNSDAPVGLGNSLYGVIALSITALAVVLIARWAWQANSSGSLYVGIMAGGATGNLLDRLIGGSVLDWIDGGFNGVFNLADVAIFVGLGLFIVTSVFDPRSEERGEMTSDTRMVDEPV